MTLYPTRTTSKGISTEHILYCTVCVLYSVSIFQLFDESFIILGSVPDWARTPQPKRRFDYRPVVKTGFCLRDFGQRQGGKNWTLPKRKMQTGSFETLKGWNLEIGKNHLGPSIGPNEGSVAMDQKTVDLFPRGKTGFCQKRYGQTYEQQPHLNEWQISELAWEVDSI